MTDKKNQEAKNIFHW